MNWKEWKHNNYLHFDEKGEVAMNKMSISPIITALENSFDWLNNRFYDGKLNRPVITMSEGKDRYRGWFWAGTKENPDAGKIWHTKDGTQSTNELNVCSDSLDRSFEEIVDTLCHEMVHCYNDMEHVQDCARSGSRHNKKFKEAAEAHGMKWNPPVEGDESSQADFKRVGFSRVSLKDEHKTEVYKGLNELKEALVIYRDKTCTGNKKPTKKSSVIKYICPCCGNSVRATKEVKIMCMDCDQPMEPDL